MVMGPTHAMSGAAVGLAVVTALPAEWGGVTEPAEVFAYAGLAAGAALLPDLDSPQATVSRSFGPLTLAISHAVENISQGFVNLTRGRKDPRSNNGHRTLTHTLWFALAMGAACSALLAAFGKPAAIGMLFFLLGLALRGLLPDWVDKHSWLVVTAASFVLAVLAWEYVPSSATGPVMASAVTVGILTHQAGDMITKRGIPFLAPLLPWRGRRWWNWRMPELLRIRASGPADKVLLGAFTLLVGVLSVRTLGLDVQLLLALRA